MNYECAKNLLLYKNGIFRTAIIKNNEINTDSIPPDIENFVKLWRNSICQYINVDTINEDVVVRHDMLNIDSYIHITSPIRRLVDLLNLIVIQKNNNLIELSDDSLTFYNYWVNKIDFINTTMRSIKKVQSDCSLLHLCYNNSDIFKKTYDGYMFDKILRTDGLYQYIIYLPELKITSRIVIRYEFNNYTLNKYKLILFTNEDTLKKKIRLQIILNI